jgi:hypothetical protein
VNRRHDDPQPNPDADQAERILAELPTILPRLKAAEEENRKHSKINRRLIWFIVVSLVVAGLAVQAVRESDLAQAYQACVAVNQNALRINLFLDAAIDSTQANKDLSADERQFRVLRYEGLKQDVPVCKPPNDHPFYNPFYNPF